MSGLALQIDKTVTGAAKAIQLLVTCCVALSWDVDPEVSAEAKKWERKLKVQMQILSKARDKGSYQPVKHSKSASKPRKLS